MITSIKLSRACKIGMNTKGDIKLGENVINKKDIPFVRYDFGSYTDEDKAYIIQNMQSFDKSVHMIQYRVGESLFSDIEIMSELNDKVVKYLYVDITQQDMLNTTINPAFILQMEDAKAKCNFDRYMIVDKTDNMSLAAAKMIIKELANRLHVDIDKIGICSSPLCMDGNLACLTAVRARELAAIYSTSNDMATPSSNHQDMNCCGCMRFIKIDNDTEAPADKKSGKAPKEKKEKSDKTDKKQAKAPKQTTQSVVSMFGNFI